MRSLRAWLLRFAGLFSRQRHDRELADEMESHLQLHIEDNLERGMTPAEARRQALIKLGGVEQTKERYRDRRGIPFLETLLQDIRFGLRMLRKSPGFTAVAVLTLALGIGANTAIFSLLDGLVLRDLPVPHPEQMVRFGAHAPDDPYAGLSLAEFQEFSRDQKVFSGTFAWWDDGVFNVESNGSLSRAGVGAVTGNFYSELGAAPEIGRLLEPGDVDLNAAAPQQIVVLSYGFWQRHYGGARDVSGKTLKIEGLPFTIIGVTRNGFSGMSADAKSEVTIPITAGALQYGDTDLRAYSQRLKDLALYAAGRLESGVTLEQARAQLESLWPAVREASMPAQATAAERSYLRAEQLKVESGAKGASFVRGRFAKSVYILLAISGVVLLIACVNLASLMLSRAAVRNHEFGVRVALGASRSRLAQQMLTESILFSAVGTLIGFALAYSGSSALSSLILRDTYIVPAALNLSPDLRVLGFTAAAAIFTGVLFGLAPAWRATREDPHSAVQQSSRTVGRGTGKLGKGLIITQVALSLVLLAGAGLFIRSLEKLRGTNPGFRPQGLLDADLYPNPGGYRNLDWASYYHQLTDKIASLPGVESAGISHMKLGWMEWSEQVEPSGSHQSEIKADCAMGMPGFFHAVGIAVLQGRTFTWRDDIHAPRIAVVSENFAEKTFPHGNAIGRRIDITTRPQWRNIEIVGVVGNASVYNVRKHAPPTVYLPSLQYGDYSGWSQLLVRARVGPAMNSMIRQAVQTLGHEYVPRITTVVDTINRSILQERVTAMLSAFFGALALLLAAIGLYGLMAYNVTRRTRELGIRFALGAQRGGILKMILLETLILTLIGVAIGVPCALAAARLIAHMLFDVTPYDPVTLATVAVALLAVGTLAGYIPARRAMRVDPTIALRHE